MFTGSTHTQRRWGHLYKGKENNIGSSFSFKSCLSHLPSLGNYSSNILYSITYKNATFPWLNPFSFSLNTSANLSAYHGKPSRVCFPNFGSTALSPTCPLLEFYSLVVLKGQKLCSHILMISWLHVVPPI